MAQKILTAKEFSAVARTAEQKVREDIKSPFYCVNSLNNETKKGGSIDGEAVAPVAAELRHYYAELGIASRYAFTLDVFTKNSAGLFCELKTLPKGYANEYASLINGEQVFFNGDELIIDCNNNICRLVPIKGTVPAYFHAFCNLIKSEKKAQEAEERAAQKAQREKDKAEKKAQKAVKKAYEKELKSLQKDFLNGSISSANYEAAKVALSAKYNF